jgi:vacuolar-type H+-ATPase catalytic subunit A/Vma1
MVKLKDNRDQMRMYSFKQLYNIFRTISNQSELHDRLCKAEGNIDEIFKNIKELRENNVKMRTYADEQISAVKSEIKSQR